MMSSDTAIDRAITDARALLDTLVSSAWQELHVVSGETEIFIARAGGGINPMRVPHASVNAAVPVSPVSGLEICVMAQHVATLIDMVPVGTYLQAGEPVATIRILDVEATIAAPVAGCIVSLSAEIGALIEYGTPILSIAQAA